jgi:MoaA/NifB/PqqE/SkfB family radical SAM enzyme
MTSPLPELINVVTNSPVISDLELDGTKVMWWADRIEKWRRGEKFAPVTMDVAWTRQCNAACSFCYAQMQANDDGQITKQHAFEFLEDAAEIGVKGVSLISDGESTVVPWYEESVEYAASCGLKIGVGTNGVRLKKRVLERILPHLSYLRFNFSAGDLARYKEIMGLKERDYFQVIQNVKDAMEIVRRDNLAVTVNMQMVTMPDMHDQIMPLARLAKELRPHYLIYKHCADNVDGFLGVDYRKYDALFDTFREAEAMGDDGFRVVVKWSRLADEGKRDYQRCFGPPFILQMSGSGLIAPCGFMFNSRYQKFHVGNITRTRFRDLYDSDRYWEVMRYLGSDQFNAQKACGPNCLQTNTNSWLDKLDKGLVQMPPPNARPPAHLEFL